MSFGHRCRFNVSTFWGFDAGTSLHWAREPCSKLGFGGSKEFRPFSDGFTIGDVGAAVDFARVRWPVGHWGSVRALHSASRRRVFRWFWFDFGRFFCAGCFRSLVLCLQLLSRSSLTSHYSVIAFVWCVNDVAFASIVQVAVTN